MTYLIQESFLQREKFQSPSGFSPRSPAPSAGSSSALPRTHKHTQTHKHTVLSDRLKQQTNHKSGQYVIHEMNINECVCVHVCMCLCACVHVCMCACVSFTHLGRTSHTVVWETPSPRCDSLPGSSSPLPAGSSAPRSERCTHKSGCWSSVIRPRKHNTPASAPISHLHRCSGFELLILCQYLVHLDQTKLCYAAVTISSQTVELDVVVTGT